MTRTTKAITPSENDLSRRIVHQTRGQQHGPITRLMSPSDLGQYLKPFVFLDIFRLGHGHNATTFPMHPHSGIATLTYLMEGEAEYEDTVGSKGNTGILPAGGVEWMQAGGGVWHTAGPATPTPSRGFQLWVALPPELENAASDSVYLGPEDLQSDGPAKVLLGSYGTATSVISSPSPMNYLAVELKAGEEWTYTPPSNHTVAWMAVSSGTLDLPGEAREGDMLVFEESASAIRIRAISEASFVIGSASKHPHDLVLGHYSVHSSDDALRIGEEGIRKEAIRLHAMTALREETQLGKMDLVESV